MDESRKYLLLTAVGEDRPGIVERITRRIVDHSGNVEESRTARLGGEFTAFFLVSVPASESISLSSSLQDLSEKSLTILTKATAASSKEMQGYVPYFLEVAGADHEGIIHDMAAFLAGRGINIGEMKTSVYHSPATGTPIFAMSATIQAPLEIRSQELRQWLTQLGDQLAVDTSLKVVSG